EDGLEFRASRGTGVASGTFARWVDPSTNALSHLDIDLSSTIPYPLAAQVYGAPGADILAPFEFDQAPAVRVRASIDGTAAPGGPHDDVRVEARADGGFRFHGFPFEGVAFTAVVRDSDITVDPVSAGFAGGKATGRADVTGGGTGRRLSLNCRIE